MAGNGGEAAELPPRCVALHRALDECYARTRGDPLQRSVLCRHLNRGLAECIVSFACPDESEAVRSMCASAGTNIKRQQCQQAQISLSLCLAGHQPVD